jgi:hypothetical protein
MFSYSDNSSSDSGESNVRAYWLGEFMDRIIYGTNWDFEGKTLFLSCRMRSHACYFQILLIMRHVKMITINMVDLD